MTGDALARAAKGINPQLPVIICTGFNETLNREKATTLCISVKWEYGNQAFTPYYPDRQNTESKINLGIFTIIFLIFFLTSSALAGHHALVASVAEEIKDSPDQQILTAVAARLDARAIFQYAPFKRRLLMLKKGEVDLACGLLKRPEREAYIHYIQPPYKKRSDTIFFVTKENPNRIQTYKDLKGLKIGITRGSKYFIQFDDDNTLHKEIVHQATANFRKLILERLDTVIINESAGIHLIHKLGISDQVEPAPFRFSRNKFVYIGISKKSGLMKRINEVSPAIREMIESGRIEQIIKNYYTSRNLPVPAL